MIKEVQVRMQIVGDDGRTAIVDRFMDFQLFCAHVSAQTAVLVETDNGLLNQMNDRVPWITRYFPIFDINNVTFPSNELNDYDKARGVQWEGLAWKVIRPEDEDNYGVVQELGTDFDKPPVESEAYKPYVNTNDTEFIQ